MVKLKFQAAINDILKHKLGAEWWTFQAYNSEMNSSTVDYNKSRAGTHRKAASDAIS